MNDNINIPDSTITTNLTFRQLVLMNMQQLTNFPYIENDFDALTDYELLCLVVKFLNDVIANQNEQNDSITRMYNSFLALQDYVNNTKDELEDAFNTLNDYVRDYFDNLDVQEEINNKLDAMLEDGSLEQIIEQFIQSSAIWGFDNVSSMKTSTNLIDGSYAKTLGYRSINDGGSSLYKIREETQEDVIDESLIISLEKEGLVAELVLEYPLNPLKLGAYGDGLNDDSSYIQKALNVAGSVKLTKGSYYIENTINVPSNRIFDGNNRAIIPKENITAISLIGNGVSNAVVNTSLKNINIDTSNEGSNGIYLKDGYFNYFENINIQSLTGDNVYGIKIVNGFNHIFKNGRILGNLSYENQIGLDISSTNTGDGIENMTNNKYENLLIQRVAYGVKTNYLTTCNVTDFENLGFSSCTYAYYLKGNARPITIHNARIEKADSNTDTYGIYIDNYGITSYIDSLNIYNITYPLYNNSTGDLYLGGACTFTGTNQNPKFNIIKSNGNVISNANIYFLSETYNFMNSTSLASGKFYADSNGFIDVGNVISSDTFDIRNNNRIYKATNRIFNLYGIRGYEALIYTESSGIVFQTSTNGSTTSLLTGDNIELTPNILYHIKFLDNNKWTLIN